MNHLVDNRVFEFLFGQVEAGAYLQFEVIKNRFPQQVSLPSVSACPEECPCVAHAYRKHREFAAENQAVKLPELLLDVLLRCNHRY